jgi:Uma2 family endonuclease
MVGMEHRGRYIAGMMPAIFTADELQRMSLPDKQVELIRGMLVVREPPGYLHGRVAMKAGSVIANHVEQLGLGLVLAADTGFRLFADPDTVRAPDVAFISRERLPDPAPAGYAALAPDLVVEVLSLTDRPGDVLAKVGDWLSAGCRVLDGEDVLPGLTLRLDTILA